jgi:hypothetical protein
MVILEHYHVLEWLDVFMLRAAVAIVPRTATVDPKAEVLVFTIQDELFEDINEFKSRSPIDRTVLQKYLQDVVRFFPHARVLAIDYDLSPNNYTLSQDMGQNKCTINDPNERKDQENIERFLGDFAQQGRKVVLIKHLPVQNRHLNACKVQWEEDQSRRGILFGQLDVLHFGLFGPVVKYVEHEHSLPSSVLAATKCTDTRVPELPAIQFPCDNGVPLSREGDGHKPLSGRSKEPASVYRINYVQAYAKGAVQICRLYQKDGVERCQFLLRKRLENVPVIFFGGDYGRDDIYSTPLGALPGVTIQAYTYFSMHERQKRMSWWAWGVMIVVGLGAGVLSRWIWREFPKYYEQKNCAPLVYLALCTMLTVLIILVLLGLVAGIHWSAWAIDILVGLGVGLLFHWIWGEFRTHAGPEGIIQRAFLLLSNFIILLFILVLSVLAVGRALAWGLWINPALIFIGLFMDSYVTAVTPAHEGSPHGGPCRLRALLGIPGPTTSKRALLAHWAMQDIGFWTIAGLAIYFLVTHR